MTDGWPAGSFSALDIAERLDLPRPTDEQIAVIEAPLAPVLVVAGAGSGKTETMSARVVWLVANGLVRPEEVLGLTFTRKAAAELANRVRQRLGQLRNVMQGGVQVGDPTVATYNAYAARVVAEHGLRAGFEPSARLLTDARTWQLASGSVQIYDGDMSYVDWTPPTVSTAVLDLAGQLAEHLRTTDELVSWTEAFVSRITGLPKGPRQRNDLAPELKKVLDVQRARLQLLPLVEEYDHRKRRDEVMDFADQVSRAARVASNHPEVGRVERARYRVVLLDEYQDTSHAQLVLLRSLFGGGHPVTAVGDPCQSIYAWRGASAGNLTRFPEHFPRNRGDTPVLPLTTSWRNGPRILELANALSAPLRGTPGGTRAWVADAVAGTPVPELQAAPHRTEPGEVLCALHETVGDEAVWIASHIAARWRAGGENPPTVAVLARTRNQFERLADALRTAGLPVEVVGLGGLLATPEVRDLVATLNVLIDPTAGGALIRLLSGARWRLGPRDLDALGRRARELVQAAGGPGETEPTFDAGPIEKAEERSIIEALDDLGPAEAYSPTGYDRLSRFAAELRSLRLRVNQPVPDLVAEAERRIGLDIEVGSRTLDAAAPGTASLARAHLDAFADVAADFAEAAETPTLSAFLAYLSAADERERGLAPGQVDVRPGAVQVLTVHAAKGLEWDVVAVPGLSGGVFPGTAKMSDTWSRGLGVLPFELRGDAGDLPSLVLTGVDDQSDAKAALARFGDAWRARALADERRLAYVAVTRARHVLLCSGAWWDAGVEPRGPSPFLHEVHEHCRRGGGTVDVWTDEPELGTENPLLAAGRVALWPFDPLGARRDEVEEAAALVVAAGSSEETEAEREAGEAWAEEAEMLLAERAASGAVDDKVAVPLPSQLTVSQLVLLRRDRDELARQLRRPVPTPPAPLARRGTAFHAWLERRFGADRLLDLDEMPGAADAGESPDDDLPALQEAFLRSEWADRVPQHVEVPFATRLGDVVLRGRIDAVFRTTSGWEVVDWKTGRPPTGPAAAAAEVQLAAYRLALAALADCPVEDVSAAFHYVRAVHTVRPVDLLDATGLHALITELPRQQPTGAQPTEPQTGAQPTTGTGTASASAGRPAR
ncbi:ATP-dependent DNA helicase [Cryptosporangium aurantiacum]|uniref:DNA 3'-5' helicase n=1 Tax=Cryptosporangium aurantiacum TaxID=134849 RepID=A0A1M7QPC4_9ACTN|nr:ATP-dependent DNA helicase [Cryptosporangium aurantiacum]SHN33005.1 DNA helicase-2 / ATP-dependent DNA helicase PcrA [Cryptosporangium aurantiacum]